MACLRMMVGTFLMAGLKWPVAVLWSFVRYTSNVKILQEREVAQHWCCIRRWSQIILLSSVQSNNLNVVCAIL